MRRSNGVGGALPAGPDCIEQFGPVSLPIRFCTADETADGHTRTVEIDNRRVLLMRSVRGVRMRLNLPLAAYLGVSVKLLEAETESGDRIALVLEHRDSALSVPLQIEIDANSVVSDWQHWGKLLGQKLLVSDSQGNLREPVPAAGAEKASPRRPRRSALRTRRPKIFKRRSRAIRYCDAIVHSGEREIIARN